MHAPGEPRTAAGPTDTFRVTIALRPVPPPGGVTREEQAQRLLAGQPAGPPAPPTSAEHLAQVTDFANAHHLRIVESAPAEHRIVVEGTVADYEAAFGISIGHYQSASGSHRSYSGTVSVPAAVAPLIEAVLGLDARPIAAPR